MSIVSPFGKVGEVGLEQACRALMGVGFVGGIHILGNYLFVRHTVPLTDATTEQLEWPVKLVATIADQLERKFSGDDSF